METQVCVECQRVRKTDQHHVWGTWKQDPIPKGAEATTCRDCEKAVKRLLEKK